MYQTKKLFTDDYHRLIDLDKRQNKSLLKIEKARKARLEYISKRDEIYHNQSVKSIQSHVTQNTVVKHPRKWLA